MEKTNPEYFSEIVYLRAIAILAVISIHVSAYFTDMGSINFLTVLYMSIDTFSSFAVPLFVCISGFVLYNKYQGSFSLKLFYKKRLLSVLPQYIIFSILGVLFIYIESLYFSKVWHFSVIDTILSIVKGTAFFHLWFFVLILQLYILYPIIEKIFTKSVENHKTLELLIFLIIIQILYQIFTATNMFLILKATLFSGYLFYFVLGMYVKSRYSNFKNIVITLKHPYILFLALLPATILGIGSWSLKYFRNDLIPQLIQIYNWISAIVTPLFYILIFTLCLSTALKISEMNSTTITKSMHIIGKYSFGIYLVHGFILLFLTSILFPKIGFDMNNWLFYPIVFSLVLSLSLSLVYIINKVPYYEYIIGSSK